MRCFKYVLGGIGIVAGLFFGIGALVGVTLWVAVTINDWLNMPTGFGLIIWIFEICILFGGFIGWLNCPDRGGKK